MTDGDCTNQMTRGPHVVMMCGVAGSGKTTYAQNMERQGYARLSIDEEIWATHGRFGIDYNADEYERLKMEAEQKLRTELVELIHAGKPVVIDFSFWQKAKRDAYKQLIEASGGRWELVYLKVSPDFLRARLAIRSRRFDANAAFPITEAILSQYLNGFEAPSGEGELVLEPEER